MSIRKLRRRTYDGLAALQDGDVEDAGGGAVGDGRSVPLGRRLEESRLIGYVTVTAGAGVQNEQIWWQVDVIGQTA